MKDEVAYLGPRGTFTHEATKALFPEEGFVYTPCDSIPDVLTAVGKDQFSYGVVPIENAIEGSVTLTLDWLIHHVQVPISGELIYPIAQHLMIHPLHKDLPLAKVERVLSHPQAVAQCRGYLRDHLPNARITYVDSTADAARKIRDQGSKPWVAIGPFMAHQLYGLHVVAESIQDYPHNFTRFIVVGREWAHPRAPKEHDKTSLLISLPSDYPGALHRVLQSFAKGTINLSRIESRPTKKKLGTYHFLIDTEIKGDHPSLHKALTDVASWGCHVRQLGSYPCYHYQNIKEIEVDKGSSEAYNRR
ncbi:prephenate dehydratase [Marininema halotolerans]|uniref:Prephenate dehydratase n=1 Tax=Marininema halotolerans TaxID=1155944 RepID=A0A1I6U4I4_9BACL|nr:prephenate dehydratase [Marininema halotolerans]SFS96332.1 prephenate dehydratase [Marininema halotolerans]